MAEHIVPGHLLTSSKKVLFVTHMTTSTFTYLQNYFIAFKEAYPHLAIDLWIEEPEQAYCFWRWNYVKKNMLFDWLRACPFINKLYTETYSPFVVKKSIKQAQLEQYDIIISLASRQIYRSIKLAQTINAHAFIVAQKKNYKPYRHLFEQALLKKINGTYSYTPEAHDHISDIYASWFQQIFSIIVPKEQCKPFIIIPTTWLLYAKLQFLKWGICKKSNIFTRVVLVNAYAKNTNQSWPLKNVFELIKTIKQNDPWGDITFLINAAPKDIYTVKKMALRYALNQLHIISADLNFFQLPAFISISDLVISVEAAVMHLACALDVPLIALTQMNNQHWLPWSGSNFTLVQTHISHTSISRISLEEVTKITLQHPVLQTSLYRNELLETNAKTL